MTTIKQRSTSKNGKSLVIVESPAKARTVARFLGGGYDVQASMGHVRDLPKKSLGVDIENDFAPTYETIKDKGGVLKEIRQSARTAESIYLATDPDREGEAISWHIVKAASLDKNVSKLKRVVFHEITQSAVKKAFANYRKINTDLVNAQQARRILDRIVGYDISPVLWRKVKRNLSAGRVQSVALRLIVDREIEIEKFKPEEYWAISVQLKKDDVSFTAQLQAIEGVKGRPSVPNKEEADRITTFLKKADYSVYKLTRKETKKKPQPPFITSTMQQEAARRLSFNAQRTMRIAQMLYEGVDMGSNEGQGLITYMRTDSTTLSENALKEAASVIKLSFGTDYTRGPRRYKTKTRNAQEAHEAIRPTSIVATPESLKDHLTNEQWRLYDLIWKRTVASQMTDAVIDSEIVDIEAKSAQFPRCVVRATGAVVKFDGFLRLYSEAIEERGEEEKPDKTPLPSMREGQTLEREKDGVKGEQRFTQPPPRYSESMLIRALEKEGIGRPSTYASIIGTIETRDYIEREKRKFKPTLLGKVVCRFLVDNFPDIMDIGFTAEMEDKLDSIAEGSLEWTPMLRQFHTRFEKTVASALEAPRVDSSEFVQDAGVVCEMCERTMVIRFSARGSFLGCSGYPECRNTKQVDKEGKVLETSRESQPQKIVDIVCERCGELMVVRGGVNGEFLGCTGYPKCKNTKPLGGGPQVKCPKCGKGELVERRSRRKGRRGSTFYGCSKYPECDFLVPRKPFETPCPKCGKLLILSKEPSRAECIDESCGWNGDVPNEIQNDVSSGQSV